MQEPTRPNDLLMNVLVEELSNHQPDFRRELEIIQGDRRQTLRAIMDALPAPLGEQFRVLFALVPDGSNSSKDIYAARIPQLLRTYQVLLEYLLFLLLSEWANFAHREETQYGKRTSNLPKALLSFFYTDRRQNSIPNYYTLLGQVLQQWSYLAPNESFITEWGALSDKIEKDLREPFMFFESLKERTSSAPIPANETETISHDAEIHLAHLLQHFSFCSSYPLYSVKKVVVQKHREQSTNFQHQIVPLNSITVGFIDENNDISHFLDPWSVLLVKDQDKRAFLNLTPFIIDKSALDKQRGSHLFFFHYFDQSNGFLYYYSPIREETFVVSEKEHPPLLHAFQHVLALFSGEEISSPKEGLFSENS